MSTSISVTGTSRRAEDAPLRGGKHAARIQEAQQEGDRQRLGNPNLTLRARRKFSATRHCWSKGIGGCDDSMKLRLSSSGCEARPAKGEPARSPR